MIRAAWLLPGILVLACERGVPHVDDPDNIVVEGEAMSQADFLEKYCIGKEKDPNCSKVLDAAAKNLIDRDRGHDSTETQTN